MSPSRSPSTKRILNELLDILSLFGINPLKFVSTVRGLPRFVRDYVKFRRQLSKMEKPFPMGRLYPFLQDVFSKSGIASSHYFQQDILIANKVFYNNPKKHVDVGSRIDGFVAHIASFREIEVIDIRPNESNVKNIKFIQQDMMDYDFKLVDYCDSVSSLHAIEHFGLGRYGDTIDVNGHLKGLNNIHKMLAVGGKLYLSVPIGKQRVEFNGQRIFDIRYFVDLLSDEYRIDSFVYINDEGDFTSDISLSSQEDCDRARSCFCGCGIYEFTKLK